MHGLSRKVALLEISRNPLLTRVVGLQYTFCDATINELLTKFPEGAFKTKDFQKVISNGVPCQKFTDLQTTALALRVFKIPKITSTVELISS